MGERDDLRQRLTRGAQLRNQPARVLRAEVPTHFAYFARRRLAQETLAPRVEAQREALAAQAERLEQAADLAGARRAQTDVVLLTPPAEQAGALARLADLYRRLPAYREILELQPLPFPQLPLGEAAPESAASDAPRPAGSRLELLLAMGLFDDAIDDVLQRYPPAPPATGLTRSVALNLGAAPRESIRAIEVLMNSVPGIYTSASASSGA